jgi:hypothetical protein
MHKITSFVLVDGDSYIGKLFKFWLCDKQITLFYKILHFKILHIEY